MESGGVDTAIPGADCRRPLFTWQSLGECLDVRASSTFRRRTCLVSYEVTGSAIRGQPRRISPSCRLRNEPPVCAAACYDCLLRNGNGGGIKAIVATARKRRNPREDPRHREAQSEPIVQPNGMADDFWWKAVASIQRFQEPIVADRCLLGKASENV